MSTTLTVRTDEGLRRALQRRAETEGKTVSGLVREILEEAVAERPMAARVSHLKGSLDLPSHPKDPWRRRLRERNWRS